MAPAVFVLPAWSNLATLDLVIGVLGAAVWWIVGTWLYWGHRLHYDENEYRLLAQSWIAGDVFALAGAPAGAHPSSMAWPGTLVRPYLYHTVLGATWFHAPAVLESIYAPIAISAVQVATFAAVVFRLAQAMSFFSENMCRAVIIGLLGMPFAVLINSEVLTESISLSIAGLAVTFACPRSRAPASRLGNVAGVLASFALLGMARTSQLPVSLFASSVILWLLLQNARLSLHNHIIALGVGIIGILGWMFITTPQVALMWIHEQLFPNDMLLWGVGPNQLLWSQEIGKFVGLIAECPQLNISGIRYPLPLGSSFSATGQISWYVDHIDVAIWHLFQALNWDFPTTYISYFNPFIIVPLNAASLVVVVVGLYTVFLAMPRMLVRFAREAPVLGVVLAAFSCLWLQTAFTAVETRFGIIPWSALSVSAAWGAVQWWDGMRRREGSLTPVVVAAAATLALLALSRFAVAGVPEFRLIEAAGCWR